LWENKTQEEKDNEGIKAAAAVAASMAHGTLRAPKSAAEQAQLMAVGPYCAFGPAVTKPTELTNRATTKPVVASSAANDDDVGYPGKNLEEGTM
jgi:hypothetical protein